jgi:hypothetical protein
MTPLRDKVRQQLDLEDEARALGSDRHPQSDIDQLLPGAISPPPRRRLRSSFWTWSQFNVCSRAWS